MAIGGGSLLRKHEPEYEQRQAGGGAPVKLWQPGEPGQAVQVLRCGHRRLGRQQKAVDAPDGGTLDDGGDECPARAAVLLVRRHG